MRVHDRSWELAVKRERELQLSSTIINSHPGLNGALYFCIRGKPYITKLILSRGYTRRFVSPICFADLCREGIARQIGQPDTHPDFVSSICVATGSQRAD